MQPCKRRRQNPAGPEHDSDERQKLRLALRMANMMLHFGMPRCGAQLVGLLYWLGQVRQDETLDTVEYFAGQQEVTNSFQRAGFRSVAYELKRDAECMNILSDLGYVFALSVAAQVRPGGFALLAPVCSTWVWICRHSVKRSYFNPLGDSGMACVRDANIMVSRCVILVLLLASRGVMVVLEQPSSSLMQYPAREHANKNPERPNRPSNCNRQNQSVRSESFPASSQLSPKPFICSRCFMLSRSYCPRPKGTIRDSRRC